MDLGIKGKVALVTGGATGLGKAIAEGLLEEGCNVLTTSRSWRRNGKMVDIKVTGGPLIAFNACNVEFGPPDILINNAGHTFDVLDPYCSQEDWAKIFRLNLGVPVELSNLVIPAMKQKGWGRIVNISSLASLENTGPVPYCAAKAALTAYTRSMGRVLATEAPGIVMSAVLPGVFMTEEGHWSKASEEHKAKYLRERCPLGRFGEPAELVPQVLLLCSQAASFMHGAIVPVDAGQSRHYFNLP